MSNKSNLLSLASAVKKQSSKKKSKMLPPSQQEKEFIGYQQKISQAEKERKVAYKEKTEPIKERIKELKQWEKEDKDESAFYREQAGQLKGQVAKERFKHEAKAVGGFLGKAALQVGVVSERIQRVGAGILRKPLLRKPKAKVPSYSSTKVLKQMARQQGALVKEAPEQVSNVPVKRSVFFKDEFVDELKRDKSWLFGE